MKTWYSSKTIWYNAVTVIVATATFFGWTPDQSLFNNVTMFLVTFAPIANIGLRLLTKQPIAGTPVAETPTE